MATPVLQILVWRTKTHQFLGREPVLPIPGCQVTLLIQWLLMVTSSLHHLPYQPISYYSLTFIRVITPQSQSPCCLKPCLFSYTPSSLDAGLFALRSLWRGGTWHLTDRALDHINIKWQGLWSRNAFTPPVLPLLLWSPGSPPPFRPLLTLLRLPPVQPHSSLSSSQPHYRVTHSSSDIMLCVSYSSQQPS